jgi:hypothetical protein
VVSYLIAIAIWFYGLRRAADWAWGSVANADAPLAYELATALAGRGHLDISSLRNWNVAEREMHILIVRRPWAVLLRSEERLLAVAQHGLLRCPHGYSEMLAKALRGTLPLLGLYLLVWWVRCQLLLTDIAQNPGQAALSSKNLARERIRVNLSSCKPRSSFSRIRPSYKSLPNTCVSCEYR